MRCDLSRHLARKITKRIHSSKPASVNRPIALWPVRQDCFLSCPKLIDIPLTAQSGRFRRGCWLPRLLPDIASVAWPPLLPVRTFFTMEGGDSELAKSSVPTLKAFLKARSQNACGYRMPKTHFCHERANSGQPKNDAKTLFSLSRNRWAKKQFCSHKFMFPITNIASEFAATNARSV